MKAQCGLEDCDCAYTIGKLSIELATLRWLAAAVVRGAIAAGSRGRKRGHVACPHGTTPFYPTHAWWCDKCFGSLELAVSLPGRGTGGPQ